MPAKKQKVLVLGSNGMLGSDLVEVFEKSAKYEVVAWTRKNLNLETSDCEHILKSVFDLNPDIIINAAAYTDVDGAEKEKVKAIKINCDSVLCITRAAHSVGAVFIHCSTDYVFDGRRKKGYDEKFTCSIPVNKYGFSKWFGENQVLYYSWDKCYVIRTSWLFGKNGKNFVKTMLKLGQTEKKIKVVNDQFGKPTYTKDLAEATLELMESEKPFGIYHLVNEGETSWFGFAEEIFKAADMPDARVMPCGTEEFPRPAKRPKYSILLNTKFPKLRNWKEALRDYLKEII